MLIQTLYLNHYMFPFSFDVDLCLLMNVPYFFLLLLFRLYFSIVSIELCFQTTQNRNRLEGISQYVRGIMWEIAQYEAQPNALLLDLTCPDIVPGSRNRWAVLKPKCCLPSPQEKRREAPRMHRARAGAGDWLCRCESGSNWTVVGLAEITKLYTAHSWIVFGPFQVQIEGNLRF